jgi:tetratricopeptide (TPR) repeat protein
MALIEAVAQLTRALAQIAVLPGTPVLRREQITLQVGLANALMHAKGYATPETKAALDQARSLIERAEALGEPPEDPLLLFSVLYGFWAASNAAFNGDVVRELATQFLALAEKQGATLPLTIGHRVMGTTLVHMGCFTEGRVHYDQAIALYDPAEHRPLALRFGHDVGVVILFYRSWALWFLGYPEAALADVGHALEGAREMRDATFMVALAYTSLTHICCGNYAAADAALDQALTLTEEKGASFWKTCAMILRGCLFASTGEASKAIEMLSSGAAAWRSTGTTFMMSFFFPRLARAYAELGRFDDAWRLIRETMTNVETTKERWCEAEVHRIAGEITLMRSRMRSKQRPISNVRSRSRVSNRQSPGNCVRR